jgi:hypothetical protein
VLQSGASGANATVLGQTITVNTGSIAAALAGGTPVAGIVTKNSNPVVTSMDVTATNSPYTITDLTVQFDANSNATYGEAGDTPTSLSTVNLMDGGTTLASLPAASSLTYSGLNLLIPANTTKTLTISVSVANIGTGAGLTGEKVSAKITTFKNLDNTGASTTTTANVIGNSIYAYAAVPQIDVVAPTTTVLNNNTQGALIKFQVQGIGGTIGFEQLKFDVTKTSAIVLTAPILWDVTANASVTLSTSTLTNVGAGSASGTVSVTTSSEQQVSTAHIYELRMNIASVSTAGDYVSTNITGGTAYFVSNTAANAKGTGYFVWSDRSAVPHSDTSSDWTRDNGIKNLPQGQTMTH